MKELFESRLIGISKSCQNIEITRNLVMKFRDSTKKSIEHILNMCKCVYEMKLKNESGELNEYDMNYFCLSVGFKEDSSTFRKFKLIGERYEQFIKYMDHLPSSYSVLYEITTLDPDKFEELMNDGSIYNYITLKDVKKLGNKIPSSPIIDDLSFNVKFNLNTIPEDELKKIQIVVKYLYQSSLKNIIEFNVPKSLTGQFGLNGNLIKVKISDEEFHELDV